MVESVDLFVQINLIPNIMLNRVFFTYLVIAQADVRRLLA